MNRKLIIITMLLISIGFGAQWVGISSDTPTDAEKVVLSSDIQTTVIQFSVSGYWQNEVDVNGERAYIVSVGEGTSILEANAPDMNKLTASIIIPDNDQMDVNVVSSEYIEYENILIAPSKGNFTRDIDPEDVPYLYGEIYNNDNFYPSKQTSLGNPYIVRDFRGQAVHVYPFQYNPVTQTLRVFTDITVEVSSTGLVGENTLIRRQPLSSMDSQYKHIYGSHFENFNLTRYDILPEQGNMLVICYESFMDAMLPFVEWKNMKGVPTEMVSVSDAGGSAGNIQDFIEAYYYDMGLTFVLLVGDIAQVPSVTVGGSSSDPSYGFIEGNDSYSEVIIGRFSAENTGHVETQVTRSVEYERDMEAGEWYHRGVGVASSQGSGIGDDGEADYQHQDNMRDLLLAYTYTEVDQIYDTNGGSSSDVSNALNEGRSQINYTGHGSMTSWSSTGFSNSHVNNLVNDNMLPFIISVACVNGQFHTGTCFAEAWLRATNGDEPTGALATMMSSINQSWAPPMQMQDEYIDIMTEQYGDANLKRTFGGLGLNGCMSMNDDYGSSGENETNHWILFGDPSIMIRTDSPADMTVSHDAVMIIGATEFTVQTGVTDALVALSRDGELLGYAYADAAGTATVILDEPILEPGELDLVVTGYNQVTYEEVVLAIVPEGPYVVMNDYIIENDSNGNGNVDYGETVTLVIAAENVGIDAATNVYATVTSTDQYITMLNESVSFGDIPAGSIGFSLETANFEISNQTPDGYTAMFDIEFTSETDTWNGGFSITVNAYCIYGDVNADWNINIMDVVETVNFVINLEDPPNELEFCAADVNENGIINIIDVIIIINYIVGDEYGCRFCRVQDDADFAELIIENGNVVLSSNTDLAGLQLTVKADELLLNDLDMDIVSNQNGDEYTILIYSVNGNTIKTGNTPLFSTNGDLQITSALIVNRDGYEINAAVNEITETFVLHQNHPNPFNPTTSISFELPSEGLVTLAIHDILGRQIAELVNSELTAGYHSVSWDAAGYSSGIYFVQMIAGDNVETQKIMLMK